MIAQFSEDVEMWIETYIRLCTPIIQPKGRGLLVVTVSNGECMPSFASLAACNDENLSRFGLNHAEAEVLRNVIRAYDEETEIPVMTLGQSEFRFELMDISKQESQCVSAPQWRQV